MLTRRTFAASLAVLLAMPSLAEARERGELLKRIAKRREGNAQVDQPENRLNREKVTISYGPAKLDIYAPKDTQNLPVMMHIHGGGWKNGNRGYVQKKPEYFTGKGYVFVSIDYRLLPEAEVAVQANDVEAAFAYLRKNIAKYGGDPARIAVMGHSAGCHLAALTGLRGGLPGVGALVLCDVENYDLEAFMAAKTKDKIYGSAFPDPSQWEALSPTTYAGTRQHPPVLIAYSRVRGHREAAVKFAGKLEAAGTDVALFDGRAYSHFSINRGFGTEEGGMTGATMAFLSRALG
jgi:acetyl esterase/lipase